MFWTDFYVSRTRRGVVLLSTLSSEEERKPHAEKLREALSTLFGNHTVCAHEIKQIEC